ncbi:MAG: PH domain-containing protein [Prevotella sp.]|nr:PH domain-containing protein [Prevotella sp.]
MEKKVYRTRYGVGLYLFVFAVFAMITLAVYEKGIVAMAVIILLYLVITLAMSWLYYVVDGGTLVICNCIVKQKIDINTIRRIEPSRSLLSAPAASLNRLRIYYGKYDELLISPARQEEFIKALLKVNPYIVVAGLNRGQSVS